MISKENFIKWYEAQERRCVYCSVTEENFLIIDDAINKSLIRLTIDSMENNKGYVKGNMVLACGRCNYTKSDLFSYEEMLEIGQKYIRPKWEERLKLISEKIE